MLPLAFPWTSWSSESLEQPLTPTTVTLTRTPSLDAWPRPRDKVGMQVLWSGNSPTSTLLGSPLFAARRGPSAVGRPRPLPRLPPRLQLHLLPPPRLPQAAVVTALLLLGAQPLPTPVVSSSRIMVAFTRPDGGPRTRTQVSYCFHSFRSNFFT
jgi:hypothetical protein